MKKVDMIVKADHIYTMSGDGVGYKNNMAMIVDRGIIIDILDQQSAENTYTAEELLDLKNQAVFPGFVDGHMHTACCILRGLAQDTNNWMMYGLQPFSNACRQEEKDAGSRLAIVEAIKCGTTTLGDYEGVMDATCDFISKIGARGNIAQTVRGAKQRVYNPGELYEYDEVLGEESIKRNLELFDKWHNHDNGRIKILFGPQGADFMSKEQLLKVQKLAKDRNTKIHMHVQQGDRETFQVVKRYGKRPVDWLQEIGYLDSSLIAVHLTDCTDEEAVQVAKSGATMIVNPGSIGIIDGVVCPSVVFQEAGGWCALGSDQAPGNNCHNIINEMKNVALFNKLKYTNPEVMPAWKALRMATIEGAKAVGLGDVTGSLEVGKHADFIAIDLGKPTMLPLYTTPMRNIVPNLVYSARGEEVSLNVVDGKIIYRDGVFSNVCEAEILNEVNKYTTGLGERASAEFWQVHGTNARFMENDCL